MSAEVLGGFVKCDQGFPSKKIGRLLGHDLRKVTNVPRSLSCWQTVTNF
jgi:hypothetical protein